MQIDHPVSRGNIEMLGEAYAFGVVWSFAMKALSVLVLRFKMQHEREYKVPWNYPDRRQRDPGWSGSHYRHLCSCWLASMSSPKEVATISGISFTIAFFAMFELTERYNKRQMVGPHQENEQFRLDFSEDVSNESLHVRPGNVLVAVRNPHHLEHLQKTLEKTDTRQIDIVVLSGAPRDPGGIGRTRS